MEKLINLGHQKKREKPRAGCSVVILKTASNLKRKPIFSIYLKGGKFELTYYMYATRGFIPAVRRLLLVVMVMFVSRAFCLIAALHSVSILRAIPCRRKRHSHIRLAVQVYPVSSPRKEKYIIIISGAIWYSEELHHVETFDYKAWFKANRHEQYVDLAHYALNLERKRITFKGHLQPLCITVVHFTEIICCNTEITNVLIVFENRIISSQPKAIAGCDTLLKRNIDTVLLSNTELTFVISILQHMISVKCTTAMHTG